jgi:uncharacterized protein
MKNKYLLCLAILSLFSCSVLFAAPSPKFLTIGAGSSGGAYYPVGIAMANIITNKVGIPTTAQVSGSLQNCDLVNSKVMDMAMTQSVMAYDAVNGLPPYKAKLPNVSAMFGGLSKGVFQLVVNKNSSIHSIKDLKGKKVCLGHAGAASITTFWEVFSAYGYTEKDIQAFYTEYDQAADSLVDGNLDAIVIQAAVPTDALTQIVAAKKPVRFISIEDNMMQKLLKKYPYYSKMVLTKDVYGTDEPANTFYIANMVIVSKELSTDLVYKLTKAIFENLDIIHSSHPSVKDLTAESAVQGLSIPLHPGAKKYFQEKRLIK